MSNRPGVANAAAALNLRRQAVLGFGTGVVLAVAAFVYFVVVPGAIRSPLYYVALGFVLALTFGLLATVVLVLVALRREVKELDDPRAGRPDESEDR